METAGRRAGRVRRRAAAWAVAAAVAFVAAAAGYWALSLYDPGPGLEPAAVSGFQVAHEGWADVELGGPAAAEVEGFFSSLEGARSLWPPRLLFE